MADHVDRGRRGEPDDPTPLPTPVAGPHHAVSSTPELPAPARRRTTSIDMTRPDGMGGPLVAEIRGRDLQRRTDGELRTTDEIALQIGIDWTTAQILEVSGPSASAEVARLAGTNLRRGYGAAVAAALLAAAADRTLLYSALEDLNGATLVSGYAMLRAGELVVAPEVGRARADLQSDICAGWARGGAVVERLRLTGANAVPMGPVAPPIDVNRGRWHELPALAPGTVRRLRCLDVRGATHGQVGPAVRAHFRDSYRGDDEESVMHEYVVTADVDRVGMTVRNIQVDPRVLPWDTCPGAVASAAALAGTPVRDLPVRVRAELAGPSTCTHLNSTLRSLADVEALIRSLDADAPHDARTGGTE